jgi:hypothetical protein
MRLKDLKSQIEERLGSEWFELEPETIQHELNLGALDFDKLYILLAMETTPELFLNDGLFLLHVTDVLNDNVAQFDHVPLSTSLELAWAIKEIEDASGVKLHFSNVVKQTVSYILRHEGFENPTPYFQDYVEPGLFTGVVSENKSKAISLYLEGMVNGISS